MAPAFTLTLHYSHIALTFSQLQTHPWKHMTHLFIFSFNGKIKEFSLRLLCKYILYKGGRLEKWVLVSYNVPLKVSNETVAKAECLRSKELHSLFSSLYSIFQSSTKNQSMYQNHIVMTQCHMMGCVTEQWSHRKTEYEPANPMVPCVYLCLSHSHVF